MSQAPQLPEQPATPVRRNDRLPQIHLARVSCTAHLMPSFCMFLLVDISESMLCPFISVSTCQYEQGQRPHGEQKND